MGKLLPFIIGFITSLVIAVIIISQYCTNLTSQTSQPEVIDLHEIQFRNYLKKFSKNYGNNEYKMRLHNFKVSFYMELLEFRGCYKYIYC